MFCQSKAFLTEKSWNLAVFIIKKNHVHWKKVRISKSGFKKTKLNSEIGNPASVVPRVSLIDIRLLLISSLT